MKSRSPKQRFDRLTRWDGPLPASCLTPLLVLHRPCPLTSCNANVSFSIFVLQKYHAATHLWGYGKNASGSL